MGENYSKRKREATAQSAVIRGDWCIHIGVCTDENMQKHITLSFDFCEKVGIHFYEKNIL